MTPEQRAALRDWVQIVAAVAVPLVVALLGWWFQTSWKEREIGRDYVKLAADILAAKDVPPALCDWASEIIRATSPIPFVVSDPSRLESPSKLSLNGAEPLVEPLRRAFEAKARP